MKKVLLTVEASRGSDGIYSILFLDLHKHSALSDIPGNTGFLRKGLKFGTLNFSSKQTGNQGAIAKLV